MKLSSANVNGLVAYIGKQATGLFLSVEKNPAHMFSLSPTGAGETQTLLNCEDPTVEVVNCPLLLPGLAGRKERREN